MADIFISYSRKDKEFVRTLHQALSLSQREAWVDWEDIPVTADWWSEIKAGIEAADTFVFVISPDSVESQVCQQEIEHAAKHHKRLFPIVRREGFNQEQVHPALRRHNWLFFREADDFEAAFATLIKAVDTDLEHVRTHTRLLVKAIEWETNERNDSFLLRGKDLEAAEQWLKGAEAKDPKPAEPHRNYIHKSRQAENATRRAKFMVSVGAGALGFMLAIATGVIIVVQYQVRVATQQLANTRTDIESLQQEKSALEEQTRQAALRLQLADAKQQEATAAIAKANEELKAAQERETQAAQRAQESESRAIQAQQNQRQAEEATAQAQRQRELSQVAYEKTLDDLRAQWQRDDDQTAFILRAMRRICELEGRNSPEEIGTCVRESAAEIRTDDE